jgi:hypothetical protein
MVMRNKRSEENKCAEEVDDKEKERRDNGRCAEEADDNEEE